MKTDTDLKIELMHARVRLLMKQGMRGPEIIRTLEKEGVDPLYASMLIDNIRTDERDRRDFWKLIIMGLFFFIGGLTTTYLSYTLAVNTGAGIYFIFWGIVVTGIIFLVRAASLYRKSLFKH